MAGVNSIQSVGQFTATYFNAGATFLGGSVIGLQGFKLEDTFISANQQMDNSKVICLVDGGAISLVNFVKAGKITINSLHFSTNPLDGDFVLIAQTLQALALSTGGILRFTTTLNGQVDPITFFGVTVANVPPLTLMGNDVPTYPVQLNYMDWKRV